MHENPKIQIGYV